MALTIKYNPAARYVSAHGDVVFTLLEDTKPFNSTTYPDYKYVCDVYVVDASSTETQVARLKSFPRPNDKLGVFDIGSVIRNYIQFQFEPRQNNVHVSDEGPDTFYVQVICRFGEEYNFTTYPNIIVDSQRAYFNHYEQRQSGTLTTLSLYLDKVMSSRPYKTNILRTAKNCFISFLASDDSTVVVRVKCYNKTLGLIRTKDYSKNPTPGSIDEMQIYNIAPVNLNADGPGTIDGIVDYYTVTFVTPNITDDSEYRFDLICESKYVTQTLHFQNRFGGMESREFTKVSRKTIQTEKSQYRKPSYVVNSDGSVSWFNSTVKVYNEQTSVYASEWTEKMQLNTDILTDSEYVWLGELMKSPLVYCEVGDYLYPVAITDSNYEEKKTINDRLTNLTLNIEFGERFTTQYR
jgi:hypothetical protein